MPTLYFVRHGKTIMNEKALWSGRTDCEITEKGRMAVEENFKEYTAKDFDVFYCSPLKRTYQTLQAIVGCTVEPIIDKRIIERDFGDWEGKTYSIIDNETTELYIQGKVDPPNGESYLEVRNRVIDFVTDLFKTYKSNESILIVAHATILRMVRDVFLPEMQKRPIKNSQLIVINNENFESFLKG